MITILPLKTLDSTYKREVAYDWPPYKAKGTKRRRRKLFYNSAPLHREEIRCKQVNPLSHPFLPLATLEIRVINGYGDYPFVSIAKIYKNNVLQKNSYQVTL